MVLLFEQDEDVYENHNHWYDIDLGHLTYDVDWINYFPKQYFEMHVYQFVGKEHYVVQSNEIHFHYLHFHRYWYHKSKRFLRDLKVIGQYVEILLYEQIDQNRKEYLIRFVDQQDYPYQLHRHTRRRKKITNIFLLI